MKNRLFILFILLGLLVITACTCLSPITNISRIIAPSTTPTQSHTDTPQPSPTSPPLPVPTFTPIAEQDAFQIPKPEGAFARLGKGLLTDFAISPDGSKIAIAAFTGVYYHDSDTLQQIWFLETSSPAYSIDFTSRGDKLVVGTLGGSAILVNTQNGAIDKTILVAPGEKIMDVAVSPDGAVLACGSEKGSVTIIDLEKDRKVNEIGGHSQPIRSLQFIPDSQILAIGTYNGYVDFWDIANNQMLKAYNESSDSYWPVIISQDGKYAASGKADQSIEIYTINNTEILEFASYHPYDDYLNSLAFSPTGDFLIAGFEDGTLILLDSKNGDRINTFQPTEGAIGNVFFSRDGNEVFLQSTNNVLSVLNLNFDQVVGSIYGFTQPIMDLKLIPDSSLIATGNLNGTVSTWDFEKRNLLFQLPIFSGEEVWKIAVAPDGKTIGATPWNTYISIWSLEDGQSKKVFNGNQDVVIDIAYSPDGEILAAGDLSGNVILWDTTSGQAIKTLPYHQGGVYSLLFFDDGQKLAVASDQNKVIIWDVNSGERIQSLEVPYEVPASLAFSADEKYLAAGCENGDVLVWDIVSGELLFGDIGHSSLVYAIAFNPVGNILASGSVDSTIVLWDMQTGQKINTLNGHSADIHGLLFSPDGQTLISSSLDGSLIFWDMSSLPTPEPDTTTNPGQSG